ncbi:unnamed protein product [Rotaria socialis]|uniref:Uncharacterized protein n=1 Tax=Rotaria socialis TaxID=392032 RepID=A0A821ABY1_9BILA|nr:unnamed protein product [Rotaria socialis]
MIGIILLGSLVATLVLYFGYSLTAATNGRKDAISGEFDQVNINMEFSIVSSKRIVKLFQVVSIVEITGGFGFNPVLSPARRQQQPQQQQQRRQPQQQQPHQQQPQQQQRQHTVRQTTTTMVPLNLLVDPGAESPGLAGWTQTGSSNVLQDTGGLEFAGYNPHTGSACFAGGFGLGGSPSSLLQNVNLLNGMQNFSAAQLDTGTLHAKISFYYQSYYSWLYPYDDAEVTITFLSNTNAVLGTQDTGYQICSSNNPGWCYYNNLYSLPVGTRSIDYKMIFTRNSGTKITAYIDDNSLTLV